MGSLYLWGRSIQEIDGDVVIGRSIYGVVVIDGSLYSRFYGIQLKQHTFGHSNISVFTVIYIYIRMNYVNT